MGELFKYMTFGRNSRCTVNFSSFSVPQIKISYVRYYDYCQMKKANSAVKSLVSFIQGKATDREQCLTGSKLLLAVPEGLGAK